MNTTFRNLCILCLFFFAAIAFAQESDIDEAETADAVEAAETVEEFETPITSPAEDETDMTADALPDDAQSIEPEEAEPVEQDAVEPEVVEPVASDPVESQAPESTVVDPEPVAARPSETFVVQGHPIFTPDQAELVYQPLVDYLNHATPYRFDLLIARDFHRYWLDVRRGLTPDLVLEEAHLTAYRISRDEYTPLVKAAEPMTYSLLTSANNLDASLEDFIGRPVSSMPSPSLGYLILSRWFENPMQQPIIQSNASSWLDAIEIVFSMEAEAAIAPHNLVQRYVNMEVVRTSQEFPGVTISASSNVPAHIQDEIRQALLVLHEDPDHFSAVHELDIERFIEASDVEYEGLDDWFSEVIRFF